MQGKRDCIMSPSEYAMRLIEFCVVGAADAGSIYDWNQIFCLNLLKHE